MTVQFVRGATAAEWSQKMTKLKPCPSCGSFRSINHDEDVSECLDCGIIFDGPKLPEGYYVNDRGSLCYNYANNKGVVIAQSFEDGATLLVALAVFLQGAR